MNSCETYQNKINAKIKPLETSHNDPSVELNGIKNEHSTENLKTSLNRSFDLIRCKMTTETGKKNIRYNFFVNKLLHINFNFTSLPNQRL